MCSKVHEISITIVVCLCFSLALMIAIIDDVLTRIRVNKSKIDDNRPLILHHFLIIIIPYLGKMLPVFLSLSSSTQHEIMEPLKVNRFCRYTMLEHFVRMTSASYDVLWDAILIFYIDTRFWQLTHWGRYIMAASILTTFANVFSWMKIYKFLLRFHCSMFLWVQLAIFKHCFR